MDGRINSAEEGKSITGLQKITKFRIFVKEGRNLSNVIWDAVDTPDSRVEIVVPLSLEKRQLTKTVEAKSNPIWNETLVFHVDTSHEDLAECEIFLIEDNFPLPNVQKGYIKCFLTELCTTLAFEGKKAVDIRVEKIVVEIEATNPRTKIYQLYKTNLHPVKIVRFHIKEGRNITNGRWWDMIDTPDTLVEVSIKLSPERKGRTKTVETKGNPVWNETLKFHYDPRMETDIECEFTLIEDNYPLPSVEVGYMKFSLSEIPKTIIFEKDRAIDLEVEFETVEPDLKARDSLCEDEVRYCSYRRQRVFKALQSLLGDKSPKDIKHVPNIAIMGSGGGFRAMIGLSGAINALESSGVLNCATYTVGLSGSAWYLTTLYSHPDWPSCSTSIVSEELKQNIKQHPDTVAMNIPSYVQSARAKTEYGGSWSFTDIFGHMIGDTIIKGRKNSRWSEQKERIGKGEAPLPLLACIHASDRVSAEVFCEWIEISPFEVFMPKYGASVKMEDFGSKFFLGKIYEKIMEPPLHFIQGVCGSAYSVLYQQLKPEIPNVETMKNPFSNVLGKIKDCLGESILNTREMRSAHVPNMMRSCSFEPCFKPLFRQLSDAVARMWEPLPSITDFLCIVDAGLSFNSPYPLVLNPQRNIDIIISFDFTNRGSDSAQPFQELIDAEEWARALHLSFPHINVERYKDTDDILEVYIFENEEDPECPIIMHFVLINKDFKKYIKPGILRETEEEKEFGNFTILDDPEEPYSTYKFQYNEKEFDRLYKLMEFNVLNNIDKIKECILKGVTKRQRNLRTE